MQNLGLQIIWDLQQYSFVFYICDIVCELVFKVFLLVDITLLGCCCKVCSVLCGWMYSFSGLWIKDFIFLLACYSSHASCSSFGAMCRRRPLSYLLNEIQNVFLGCWFQKQSLALDFKYLFLPLKLSWNFWHFTAFVNLIFALKLIQYLCVWAFANLQSFFFIFIFFYADAGLC